MKKRLPLPLPHQVPPKVQRSTLSAWNVAPVADFSQLFGETRRFNQDVSSWRVESARDMRGMFLSATAFNQDLCSWGQQLADSSAEVADMFETADSCPSDSDTPSLLTNPAGPFCRGLLERGALYFWH